MRYGTSPRLMAWLLPTVPAWQGLAAQHSPEQAVAMTGALTTADPEWVAGLEANFGALTGERTRATFWQGGQQIADGGQPIELGQKITAQKLPSEDSPRTHAELVQLGIALLIALLGLLAGATEQLQKLDILAAAVAVFLLGFGADSIKNALAPAKPEAKAGAGGEAS